MDALLAAVVGILSPGLLKFIPLKGIGMVIFTWVASFALAAGDIWLTKGSGAFSASSLSSTFAIIYALQQVVYAAFVKNEAGAVQ